MLRPYVVQDDVGVPRHWFPEDPTLPVSCAPGLRARRRLEVVDEPLHDAPFHETRGPGGNTLVVYRTRRGATHAQGIVAEREARVEQLLAHLRPEGGNALQHGLPGQALGQGQHQRRQSGRREDNGEGTLRRCDDAQRVIVTLMRQPSRARRSSSERPVSISWSREAFAARSKNVASDATGAGAGNSRSSSSPSLADAKARSSRGAACCLPTSFPPTAVVPATPTRPRWRTRRFVPASSVVPADLSRPHSNATVVRSKRRHSASAPPSARRRAVAMSCAIMTQRLRRPAPPRCGRAVPLR